MSNKKDIKPKAAEKTKAYLPNMIKLYKESVVPAMVSRFNYVNSMQVPKLLSISLNMGLGDAKTNSKKLESAISELELITGQKPIITKSKKANASFKLREGMPIGVKVTLRKSKMYEFVDRFVNIALPRVRDFRGVKANGDGRGNFTIGVKENIIFPELDIDKVKKILGMDITIVTSANTTEEGKALLEEFGFPFKKNNK